jgi:hypothetical protein
MNYDGGGGVGTTGCQVSLFFKHTTMTLDGANTSQPLHHHHHLSLPIAYSSSFDNVVSSSKL